MHDKQLVQMLCAVDEIESVATSLLHDAQTLRKEILSELALTSAPKVES